MELYLGTVLECARVRDARPAGCLSGMTRLYTICTQPAVVAKVLLARGAASIDIAGFAT